MFRIIVVATIHVAAPRIQSVGNERTGCEVGAERFLVNLPADNFKYEYLYGNIHNQRFLP